MEKIKISIGSDHAGYELKKEIIEYLNNSKIEIVDEGTDSIERCDYVDFAKKVAKKVAEKTVDKGILICGTGIGMAISSNKIRGIKAALCVTEYMAKFSRLHNDSNILCLGARTVETRENLKIVKIWLETDFEGGRHIARLKKIENLEKENNL